MLQQVLQFPQREAEVFGDLAKLAIRQLDAIVVREGGRSVADPKNYVRTALTQLLESSLEREPDLSSLWHKGSISFNPCVGARVLLESAHAEP